MQAYENTVHMRYCFPCQSQNTLTVKLEFLYLCLNTIALEFKSSSESTINILVKWLLFLDNCFKDEAVLIYPTICHFIVQ